MTSAAASYCSQQQCVRARARVRVCAGAGANGWVGMILTVCLKDRLSDSQTNWSDTGCCCCSFTVSLTDGCCQSAPARAAGELQRPAGPPALQSTVCVVRVGPVHSTAVALIPYCSACW